MNLEEAERRIYNLENCLEEMCNIFLLIDPRPVNEIRNRFTDIIRRLNEYD